MRVRYVKNAKEYLDEHPEFVVDNYQEYKGKWKEKFKNNNPIYIEIGMGKGKFIIENALNNPNINYIGIEKDVSIVYKALNKVLESDTEKLNNLILLCADAADINTIFENKEVNKEYLNFSDPWPKTRHEKRRLTGPNILNGILDILDGSLEFKTDNRHLFEYSIMEFNKLGLEIIDLSLDLHSDKENIITTEYEEKFMSKGNVIYYCEVIKNARFRII